MGRHKSVKEMQSLKNNWSFKLLLCLSLPKKNKLFSVALCVLRASVFVFSCGLSFHLSWSPKKSSCGFPAGACFEGKRNSAVPTRSVVAAPPPIELKRHQRSVNYATHSICQTVWRIRARHGDYQIDGSPTGIYCRIPGPISEDASELRAPGPWNNDVRQF